MKRILFIILSIAAIHSFGQGQEVELADHQLSINFLSPSISYQKKIKDNQSFTLAGGVVFVGEISDDFNDSNTSIFAAPNINSTYRNYYTRKSVKKDNLGFNSGNYIGLYAGYVFEPLSHTDFILGSVTSVWEFGPVWGFERNYASGIHLGLNIGPGLIGGPDTNTEFRFIGSFEFGFVIFSK